MGESRAFPNPKRCIVLSALILLGSAALAIADEVKMKDGTLLEGTVIENDSQFLYLEKADGLANLPISDIVSVNGKPLKIATKTEAPEESLKPAHNIYIHQGRNEDLVARVGRGGISRREFGYYLKEIITKLGIDIYELPDDSRAKLLEHAVKLETVFQAALDLGLHGKDTIRQRIIGYLLEKQVLVETDISDVPEKELMKFYENHRDVFLGPAKVKWKSIFVPDPRELAANPAGTFKAEEFLKESAALARDEGQVLSSFEIWNKEGDDLFAKVKAEPAAFDIWSERKKWQRQDKPCSSVLGPFICPNIFLQEIDEIVSYKTGNGRFFIWLTEREEPEPVAYDQLSRDRLARQYFLEKERERLEQLLMGLKRVHGELEDDELLFRGAMERGYHRLPDIRKAIIFEYVRTRSGTLNELVQPLKARYLSKVLVEDFSDIKAVELSEVWNISRLMPRGYRQRDPVSGNLKIVSITPLNGQDPWWKANWAPLEIDIEEGRRPPTAGPEITEKGESDMDRLMNARSELIERSTPLREEEDQLAKLANRFDPEVRARERAESREKMKQQLVYVIIAIVIVNLIYFVLRRRKQSDVSETL